jgi:hypothetical protein
MGTIRIALCGLAILITGTAAAPAGGNELSPSSLDQYLAAIKPQKGEWRWADIPWVTDPVEAIRRSAEEGKPILIAGGSDGSCVNGAQ